MVAGRGEIARRALAAGRKRGFRVAAISTPADAGSLPRQEADQVLEVGSFLDAEAVVAAASRWGADLLHPGYGFLSENAGFAAAVEAAGIAFVGPSPEAMRRLGDKQEARALAGAAGVPVLPEVRPGDGNVPLAVKAAAGGGGRGIRVVRRPEDLAASIEAASREAESAFGDPTVFLERWIDRPRHVEVQVFGDGEGGGVHFGERECSAQRRRQKLVEWAPAAIDEEMRQRLCEAALRLVEAARYRGAGTVEFLLEGDAFWFLEVNTRLQVEHPVTEEVHGVDLVDLQLELAENGWPDRLAGEFPARGAAIEARVLAEGAGFVPSAKQVRRFRAPEGVRCDSGVGEGSPVPPEFDSLLAKVIGTGDSFEEARKRLVAGLKTMVVHGPETNLGFLGAVLEHPDFRAGRVHTGWVEERLAELAGEEPPFPGDVAALRDRAAGRRADPGVSIFRRPGEETDAVVTELPGGVAVTVDGRTTTLREETARATAPGEAGSPEVKAPLSGKVLRLFRNARAVREGEVVAVIESMKMRWEVRAPATGVPGEPEVEEGAVVEAGAVLMRIDPET